MNLINLSENKFLNTFVYKIIIIIIIDEIFLKNKEFYSINKSSKKQEIINMLHLFLNQNYFYII